GLREHRPPFLLPAPGGDRASRHDLLPDPSHRKPAFPVRINDVTVTQYTFVDGDEAERTWHEIIPASTDTGPALRPDRKSWSSSLATVPSSSGMSASSTRRTRPPFRSPSAPLGHSAGGTACWHHPDEIPVRRQ